MITNISQNGIDLIKKWEGLRLKAYKCPAGVFTIGYGHTKGVKAGDTITEKEADALLYEDLDKYVDHVRYYDEKYHYDFNQNEFDALVSFAFNIGSLRGLTNEGKRTKFQISCKIKSYVYAGGKKMQGLINRRNAEYNLYMKPEVNIIASYLEIGKEYKVVVSGLRIRKEPTTESDIIKSIKKGSKVSCNSIKRDTAGNTWIGITGGYIAAIYEGKYYVKEV